MRKFTLSPLQVLVRHIVLGCVLGSALPAIAAEPETAAPPAPRDASGRILISRTPDERLGLWVPANIVGTPVFDMEAIAFKPWAKGLWDARQKHDLEPHARCKASGAIRQFLTPYGLEILEMPELKRLYLFDIGGPHTFREVYMDGRAHPEDLEPTNYGHNIGWWEGDTLVIDSVGYNTDFWFDRSGMPHTEAAHVTEYLTRVDKNTLKYRFVLEDETAYDSPVVGNMTMRWGPQEELFEYMCQQSNYAAELMVNSEGASVGSTSPIIP